MDMTTSFYRSDLKRGLYRHYKGKLYRVLGTARHSESEETLVVYAPEGQTAGEAMIWARPLGMFTEEVETPQGRVARFAFVEA